MASSPMHQLRYILFFLIAACILCEVTPSMTAAKDPKDANEELTVQGKALSGELDSYLLRMKMTRRARKKLTNCRGHAELLKDLAICSLDSTHTLRVSKEVFEKTPKVDVSNDIKYIFAIPVEPDSYELCMAISVEMIAMAAKRHVQAIEWAELFVHVRGLKLYHPAEEELLEALMQKSTGGKSRVN